MAEPGVALGRERVAGEIEADRQIRGTDTDVNGTLEDVGESGLEVMVTVGTAFKTSGTGMGHFNVWHGDEWVNVQADFRAWTGGQTSVMSRRRRWPL